jgi:hypothetical protein
LLKWKGRSMRATRVVQLMLGKRITGKMVCHHCDNPPCCNPAHLYLGNAKRNAADRGARWRHQHGERHWKSKLTAKDIPKIRARRAAGETIVALGLAFGVSHAQISMVCRRKNWTHIP